VLISQRKHQLYDTWYFLSMPCVAVTQHWLALGHWLDHLFPYLLVL